MAWTPRTRAQIKAEFLADLSTRFALAGIPLNTGESSYHDRLGAVLAIINESLEVQAQNNTNDILPDKASETALMRHGEVEGVTREAATKAVLAITITGTPSATVTFGSSRLVSPAGLSYIPSANSDGTGGSVVIGGGGSVVAYMTCQTAGIDGNLADSSIVTWSSTPTNANSTAIVISTFKKATDQESISSYAARILERRRERPASGNRADWKDWAQAVDGVDTAFVYSLWHQTYGTNTRGAVTVVVLGPPQGTSATNTKILTGGGVEANVAAYIEGTKNASGVTVTNGTQLRPVTIESGSYVILPATESVQAVTIVLTMASDSPFPWTSPASYTVTAYNTTTREITLSADPVEVTAGDTIAVRDTGKRGLYTYGIVSSVNHSTNKVTMDSGFTPGTVDTTASGRIRPAPPTATSIRDAIFDYFDTLTPGDTSPGSRWPLIDSDMPSVLYRPALVAGAISNAGGSVLSASVTTPSSDQTPSARQLFTLGELILSP